MSPLIDLTGKKFGKLTVIRRENGGRRPTWLCRCDCGNFVTVLSEHLRYDRTKSCGCLGGKFIDLTGRTFGRLKVVKRLPSVGWVTMWRCKCSCGNAKPVDVRAGNLTSGNTQSCGCLNRERTSKAHLIDLVGQVFGRLSVIRRVENKRDRVAWLCECACGADVVATAKHLRNGNTQSCGCLQKERTSAACLIDLTGRRFGRLLVVGRVNGNRDTLWMCKCDCGGAKRVGSRHLLSGAIRSCGCLRTEAARGRSGPNHPNWRHDLTDDERARKRNSNKNREWRYAVYERDDYTCQVCCERGGALEAHHLDAYSEYRSKRFLVANGITLCVKCHDAFHAQYGRGENTVAQFEAFLASYVKERKRSTRC